MHRFKPFAFTKIIIYIHAAFSVVNIRFKYASPCYTNIPLERERERDVWCGVGRDAWKWKAIEGVSEWDGLQLQPSCIQLYSTSPKS